MGSQAWASPTKHRRWKKAIRSWAASTSSSQAWPNPYKVTQYAHALRGGHEFPPVIADRVSRRLVDGWHRCHAVLMVYGEDASIDVEWRDYPDELAIVMSAGELNRDHGEPLTGIDRANLAELDFKLEPREIARILATEERQVVRLLPRYAEVPDGVEGSAYSPPGDRRTAIKRGFSWLQQRRLTAEQFQAHEHVGYPPLRSVNDVISALAGDLFNWDAPNTRIRLCLLQRELQAALDLHGVACED